MTTVEKGAGGARDQLEQGQQSPSKRQKPSTELQKWTTVAVACLVCFVVGINATAVLSATEDVADRFAINTKNPNIDYIVFLNTAWNAGAAIVPLFVLPAFEDFGVRPIYLTSYVLFVVFVMVQAVAPNYATLIVSRVIAGSFGGVLQNAVDGIAADVWDEDVDRRAVSLTLYVFSLLGGVTIGPVVGGGIIRCLYWRWILYIQLMIYGAVAPIAFFFLRETRPEARGGLSTSFTSRFSSIINDTVLRSGRFLFTEFTVAAFTLWSSFAFGTVFILIQSIPQVYTTLYFWEPWQIGVVQVSIFIGELIGVVFCILQDVVVYPFFRHHTRVAFTDHRAYLETGNEAPSSQVSASTSLSGTDADPEVFSRDLRHSANPEARLYTSVPMSFLGLTAGFFIYAWTSQPASPAAWPVPTIGLMLIGVGIQGIIHAVSIYITDCYPSHAASAISAVAFGENILAAILPLATKRMYEYDIGLGYQWASSLLGFVALALSFVPVVLIIVGEKIRSQSKWAG